MTEYFLSKTITSCFLPNYAMASHLSTLLCFDVSVPVRKPQTSSRFLTKIGSNTFNLDLSDAVSLSVPSMTTVTVFVQSLTATSLSDAVSPSVPSVTTVTVFVQSSTGTSLSDAVSTSVPSVTTVTVFVQSLTGTSLCQTTKARSAA